MELIPFFIAGDGLHEHAREEGRWRWRSQGTTQDRMGGSQSFGSNYRPSSQSRKMSIGIVVESLAKKNAAATKEAEITAVETEKVVYANGNMTMDRNNVKDTRIPGEEGSQWISTGPFNLKIPTSGTIPDAKTTSPLPAIRDQQTAETTEEVPVVNGDKTENVGSRQNNNLKMRLLQILGTVSSPKSPRPFSQDQDAHSNTLREKQVTNEKADGVVKLRPNSDSIETDSECPDNDNQRPVTRSSIRKKASKEMNLNKNQSDIPSSCKQKHQEKSIFQRNGCLQKKARADGLHGTAGNLISRSTRKKNVQMKSSTKPKKLLFPEYGRSGKKLKENLSSKPTLSAKKELPEKHKIKTQKANYRRETFPPADKESPLGNYYKAANTLPPERLEANSEKRENRTQKADCRSKALPPADKASLLGKDYEDANTSPPESKRENSEALKNTRTKDSHQSPKAGFTSPNLSSSPSLISETDQMRKYSNSPEIERFMFTALHFKSPRSGSGRKPLDVGEDSESSKLRKAETNIEDEDNESSPSEPSVDERDYKRSIEGSPIIKSYGGRKREAKKIEAENQLFSHPIKRFRSHEGGEVNELSPTSKSPRGTGESDWIEQDNGLSRAVVLIALSLDKLKRKMTSATTRKCSEILQAVADGVHLQFKSVESQIHGDLGRLTALGKTTRKQLESRFQEQQEHLKSINRKFQEETKRHLQDYKSIIEDLDSQQLELRGTMEEQKTSHWNLILEVEEAVEVQLGDAQRRIAAVQEMARKQMLQLREAIAECLEDGVN